MSIAAPIVAALALAITCRATENAVIASVIDYLNIHELIFIRNQKGDTIDLGDVKTEKLLYVSLLSYRDLQRVSERGRVSSLNPLVVLNETDRTFNRSRLIQLSLDANFSPFNWILFTEKFNLEHYKNLRIPFDCEFMIAEGSESIGFDLMEMYDTTTLRNLKSALGHWSPGKGLITSGQDFISRRSDLHGSNMNVSTHLEDPCNFYGFAVKADTVAKCIHLRVLPIVAQKMNFSLHWIVDPDIDLYGQGISRDVQLTIFDFVPMAGDPEGFTMLWPSFRTELQIYTGYTGLAMEWNTYMMPFSPNMWLAVLAWLVLSAAIYAGADFILQKLHLNRKISYIKMWLTNFFTSYSAFCTQGESSGPMNPTLMILYYLMFLIPTALVPGYSAALTSFLTAKLQKMPFTNLEGLSKAKDYRLGHHPDFPFLPLIKTDASETMRELIRDILVPLNEMPKTETEGILRICKSKFSWLCTVHTIKEQSPPCPYYQLDRPIFFLFTALPIHSDSPYKALFDRTLRSFAAYGIMEVETMRVVGPLLSVPNKHGSITIESIDQHFQPIMFENVVSLCVVISIAYLITIGILFVEIVVSRSQPLHSNLHTFVTV